MKTFIFDYDDTLAANQYLFNYAIVDFQKYILDKMGYRGPHPHSIVNIFTDIELKKIKEQGFSVQRFPESFVDTFKKLSELVGHEYTDRELKRVYKIGMNINNIKPGLLHGAEDVLNFLTEQGDDLFIYTKGEKELQQRKIDLNNLQRWFAPKNIHIVEDKNHQDLAKIVGKRDKDRTFKVGNSIRSDVNPALEIGLKAIYIPCDTWVYETTHDGFDESDTKVFVFDSLTEIIENYEGL